ncbi:MAG: hypothetical protein GY786_05025, partial [Proteobacteria bacterium]|nr:hypothetical protein [Pseudomonadota bacterium]
LVGETVLKILPLALNRYFSSDSPIARPKMVYRSKIQETDLALDWQERSDDIIRKINAGDSLPGSIGLLSGQEYRFYGAEMEKGDFKPGEYRLTEDGELMIGTGDGCVRITRIARLDGIKVRPEILLEA